MSREPMGDVVVVVPGILGSALEKDGKTIWDMRPGAALRALISLGGSVRDLMLDGDDPDVDDLGDGVRPTRILPDLHLLPGLWKIDGYGAIQKRLHSQFDLEPGRNYFEFAYDWRRDNRVAARRLRRESARWLGEWRRSSGNDDARLVLLAHSMGGLVSRAFLELEEGWRDTRTLVTFGTPFRGSLNAVNFIANGFSKGIGPLRVDLSEMLRSLTSVYQLLPIYPCITDGDGELRRPSETSSVPHLDAHRASEALAFHRSMEDAVLGHRGETAYTESGYRLEPVVGSHQPTINSARVDGDRVVMSRAIDGETLLGDGTVPRPAAQPPEVGDAGAAVFSGQPHASLQNEKSMLDHVTGLLTASTLDLGRFRTPERRIGLVTGDLWIADEGAEVEIETDRPEASIRLTVRDAETDAEVAEVPDTGQGTTRRVEVPGVAPGTYRVTAHGEKHAVTDAVLVLGPN